MLDFKIWPVLLSWRWVYIYILEKSDMARNLTFCLCLFFNVYIMHHNVSNVRSAQRWLIVIWFVAGERFSLAFSKTSWISNPNPFDWSGWSFDQRYSINMIMRRVTNLKLKFLTLFFASMLTSCIIMSTMLGRLGIGRPWCDLSQEETFLWHSPKHLGPQTLIHRLIRVKLHQRYSVNLIMRRVRNLKSKFLTLSLLQCWHHASQCQQCSVGFVSIDRDVIHWMRKLFFGAFSNILDPEP